MCLFRRSRDYETKGSRAPTLHAIASVLAAQVYDVLKQEHPETGKNPNEAYVTELRKLTAASWRESGVASLREPG